MTTRREFLRRGALWVAAAAVVEPVARKLWAFPTNPLGRSVAAPVFPLGRFPSMAYGDELEFSYDSGTARVWLVRQNGHRVLLPADVCAHTGGITIHLRQEWS